MAGNFGTGADSDEKEASSADMSEDPSGRSIDPASYEISSSNPNIVRARGDLNNEADETAGQDQTRQAGNDLQIIEGSDSERTGTSWGLEGVDRAPVVSTPQGEMPEGEGQGEASPTRNVGSRLSHDDLKDVGSWGTISNTDSAGSPTGNS